MLHKLNQNIVSDDEIGEVNAEIERLKTINAELREALIEVEKHLPGVVKMLEIEAFEGKSIENAKAALRNARSAIAKAKGGAA